MPYKDLEKKRETQRAWREKNKEKIKKRQKEYHEKNREKLRLASLEYNNSSSGKIVRANYRDTHKEENKVYREKNKEKIKKRQNKNYLKNREAVIKRTTKYHHEHKEERQLWYAEYYQDLRLKVLAMIDPDMKCAMCGCEDTRFLEVNHMKGGGNKERKRLGKEGNYESQNMILLIHNNKRGIEDLNLLCRACNAIDHLERVFGKTGLKVVWDKE
jgi:hypothetical protein